MVKLFKPTAHVAIQSKEEALGIYLSCLTIYLCIIYSVSFLSVESRCKYGQTPTVTTYDRLNHNILYTNTLIGGKRMKIMHK